VSSASSSLPSDLTLRDLGPADAAEVAGLIAACDQTYLDWAPDGWQPPPEKEERAKWEERLAEPDRWSKGAVDSEATLIAMVVMRQARDEEDQLISARGHLGALFVHPARQRQGIARRLMLDAEQKMRSRGFRQALLRTPEGAPARRFYEAVGWTGTGEREFRHDFGMWVVHYEKQLVPVP
jgi:GNAT superfamily N-acetyltransferase